jgi:hypothetical protein
MEREEYVRSPGLLSPTFNLDNIGLDILLFNLGSSIKVQLASAHLAKTFLEKGGLHRWQKNRENQTNLDLKLLKYLVFASFLSVCFTTF